MPDIRDEATQDAIAQKITSNGRKKGKAMRDTGYSDATSKNGTRIKGVCDNVRVKAKIKAIDDKTADKLDFSREGQLKKLQTVAEDKKAPHASVVSAIRAQNSMLGYDQEKAPNEEAESQRRARITSEDKELAEIAANQRVIRLSGGLELNGPDVAKTA